MVERPCLTRDIIDKIKDLEGIPCNSLYTMHWVLKHQGIINFSIKKFLTIFSYVEKRKKNNDYPLSDEYDDILKFEFYDALNDHKASFLSPQHAHAYKKSLECKTGEFTLKYLRTMDKELGSQILNINNISDPKKLTDQQLEHIILNGSIPDKKS